MNSAANVFKDGGCKIGTKAMLIKLAFEAATLLAVGGADDRVLSVVIGLAAQ